MGKKREYVKNRRECIAVTEVVGTMLLLLISVTFFSIVYISVLSIPSTPPTPSANIACTVVGNKIILDHFGGDSLDLETKLMMTIGGVSVEKTVGNINSTLSWDENNDQKWNMGEKLVYIPGDLTGKQVEIRIVDVESNSLVMMGILHEGISSVPSLATSVDRITPYNQTHSPFTITSNGASALDNVTLWYRYSTNNASGSWSDYSSFDTDSSPSWQWSFDFPDGTGYYEFYSIGMYSGDEESTPASADTMCFYNQAPEISNPYPANDSTGVSAIPTLNITVSDADGNPMNITWYSNSSESWQIFGTNISVSNGTYHQTNNNFSNYGRTYYWYVSASDGNSVSNSPIYRFTIEPIDTWVDSVNTSSPYEITASGPSDLSNVSLWYQYSSNNWSHYRTITIDHTKIDENLVNFPVLVKIDSTIGSKCDGGDSIRFFDVDNSTEYYYEIEHWDGSGDSYVWVKIPSVSATEDTVFLMHYNNSNAVDNQHPEDVWGSNYAMVQHLSETSKTAGSYNDHLDSTSNDNDGETQGTNNMDVEGQIDGADNFDGTDDYLSVADSSSLKITGDMTIEAWIYWKGYVSSYSYIAEKGRNDDDNYGFLIYSNNRLAFEFRDTGNQYRFFNEDTGSVTTNTWEHVVVVYDDTNNNIYFYSGGVETHSESTAYSIKGDQTDDLWIGRQNYGSHNFRFYGKIDEVCISNTARNASWIKASYQNQNDISSFLTIGSEQSKTEGANWVIWNNISNPDISFPWSWNFDFSNGSGYYEFYSIGKKTGSPDEIAPGVADAVCNFIINSDPYTPSNPAPSDGADDIGLNPTLSVTVSDPDGDPMNVAFHNASDGSVIGIHNSVPSGGTASVVWTGADQYLTTYYWYAVADDGIDQTTSPIWHFTTQPQPFQECEDFSGSFPPSGWITDDWSKRNSNYAGGTAPEARLKWNSISGDYAYLQSNPTDTTGVSSLILSFNHSIDHYTSTFNCRVYTRSDGSDSWADVTPWSNPISGNVPAEHVVIDITSDIGSGTQVRFEFDGDNWNINYWYIDDVCLEG